jgi:extradiol dioxygenase family protein
MTEGVKTIIYPVKDLAKAKTLYSTELGSFRESTLSAIG